MSAWRTLAVFALLALAQTPQFRSGIDVARFDVVVLDKDRRPITGLTAADFRVSEDGRTLRVAAFEAVTIPSGSVPPPAAAAAAPAAPAIETVTNRRDVPGRLVVIVMDRTIPYERPLITARAVANAAVDAMGPNDLGAVIFTSGFPVRPQGFTASRERLRAAIASVQMGATTDMTMTPQGLSPGGIGSNPGDACPCGGCTMSTLTTIANALVSVNDYRKMILFIGGDLALGENAALASAPECRGMVRGPSLALLRALDRANVTVHSVDPRGLETTATRADNTPPEPADARMNRQGNLKALPEYTGGRAILASNEPEKSVSALFAEDRTYYVIAVERDRPRPDGKPHGVTIDVARQGATVLGRNAYYDAADVPRGVSSDPLERAIAELLPRTDLPLRMTLAPGTDKSSSVDVTLATPRAAPARADVLVAVFDQFAKQVGSERARVELPARGGADVEWKMHLNPKPGRYEVRAAVRIGDAIGTVAGYVDVPKAASRAEGAKRRTR